MLVQKFQDKVALITGGGSGIGQATVLAFAREGAKVVVVDLGVDSGEATVAAVQAAGGEAAFIQADVTQPAQVKAMVHRVVSLYGRLDCAVNSAGVAGGGVNTHMYPEDEWYHIINVNLTGVFLCMKHQLAQMMQQGIGAIVNLSSAAGLTGQPGAAAYSASKHGVIGLTRSAALECARSGIRINAICPSAIITPMWTPLLQADPQMEAKIAEAEPMGRMGTPEEVAETIIWLCSGSASFINGHALAVDGGLTIR